LRASSCRWWAPRKDVRIGIIGLGLMGGSFALALRRVRPGLELIGSDADPATLREAVRRGMVSPGEPREAHLVVLAAPIGAMPELLAHLGDRAGVVTDMASTKGRVMGWAAAAGVDRGGGHPR